MRGLGLGFANPVGTGGVLDVSMCLGCGSLTDVGGEWVVLTPGSGGVRGCYVGVSCESGSLV